MKRFVNSKSIISMLMALALVAAFAGGIVFRSAAPTYAASPKAGLIKNPICSRLGQNIQASSGAQMYCNGPQSNGAGNGAPTSGSFGSNVNAANPHEDVTPSGVRAYGQSEVSVASTSSYVVEAWNDATGFFAPCPSPMFKEELTGFGFSANGGTSFKDEGGLPNDCTTGFKYEGDPSVETWQAGGKSYFYISSLYLNGATGQSDLALDACKATGSGSTASLSCSMPIIVATGGPGEFLDKDFLTIDPAHGRLYMSYTRFGAFGSPSFNGQIELAVCDIGTPSGGPGPAGGTAGAPVCFPGASTAPYFVVAPGDPNCENEGAYPATHVRTGDVYVAWEFNWATNFENSACFSVPTQNKVAYVPFSCLTLTPVSPCVTTPATVAVNIVSLDAAFIPGYNRFPANDFPRIAVSNPFGTVSIVWNDARSHPLGDILLQSYNLVSLSAVTNHPVRINPDIGGMHFLPALRKADDGGNLSISYYQRDTANTDSTNVDALINLNPRTASFESHVRVTTGPSAWLDTSSDIIPNFGDYTDNYMLATPKAPYTNDVLYVAWSDGRLGVPQPFEAHGMS